MVQNYSICILKIRRHSSPYHFPERGELRNKNANDQHLLLLPGRWLPGSHHIKKGCTMCSPYLSTHITIYRITTLSENASCLFSSSTFTRNIPPLGIFCVKRIGSTWLPFATITTFERNALPEISVSCMV